MRKIAPAVVMVALWTTLIGCGAGGAALDRSEIVLCAGSRLTFIGGEKEVISINAESTSRRAYSVADVSVLQDMIPRKERWYGSLGLYSPVGSDDIHVVSEEGFQYFASRKEFFDWLSWKSERLSYAYTSQGMVVGWSLKNRPIGTALGPRAALSVELWQVFIAGEKPVDLAGANDQKFNLELKNERCSNPVKFSASKPRNIGGRLFSGRALDFISERDLSFDKVSEVISGGRREARADGVVVYNDSADGGLFFVLLNTEGDVLLIG